MNVRYKSYDFLFLSSIFFLVVLSLLMMYGFVARVEENVFSSIFSKQFLYVVLGFGVFFMTATTESTLWKKYSTPLFLGSLFLLVVVLLVGKTIRGTVGWVEVGPFHFQPVELVKVLLIVFLASFISQKRLYLSEVVRLVVSFVLTLLVIGLVLFQPDLGSAMILLSVWCGMIFLSGIRKRYVVMLAFSGLVVAMLAWSFLAPYQQERILTVIDPMRDAKGSGYNVVQSMVAVGSGGIVGKGIGQGTQSQLNFLPEKHTDFIFSATAESLGFVGVSFILVVYGVFLSRIVLLGARVQDNFGFLVVCGVFIMLSVQIVINVGMNLGIMPVTGIPLPFLSYGGSSMLSVFFACGLLVSVFRSQPVRPLGLEQFR